MAETYLVYRTVRDFVHGWKNESDGTRKLLGALTDASLKHAVHKDHRTIGRVVWHICCFDSRDGQSHGPQSRWPDRQGSDSDLSRRNSEDI